MKILILTRFYLNGQTSHILTLCSELVKMKQKPYLIMSNLDHPGYLQWLQRNNIPFSTKADSNFLCNLIKKHRFHLIHTHSVHTLEIALELGRQFNIPVIATCHYLDFQHLNLLAQADKIITISREMYQLLNLPQAKTAVIENGINTALFRPKKPRTLQQFDIIRPSALIVTRMTSKKEQGYINLVEVLLQHNWKVISIGNWRPHGLGITYTGWQIDLSNSIPQADLVIGTGRSIRKGMASGCAVLVLGDYLDGIVTPKNVGFLREYNFSGRAGKRHAHKYALTHEIDSLTPDTLVRLQTFGYQYGAEHFSQQKMAEETLGLYQSCFK